MTLNLYLPIFKMAEDLASDLPQDERKPFIAAINEAAEGKDLSVAHWHFLKAELRALPHQQNPIRGIIHLVIAGMDRLAAGKEWPGSYEVSSIACSISASGTSRAAIELAGCAAEAGYYASGAIFYSSACASAETAAEAARAAACAYDDVPNYTVGIRRVNSRLLKFIENAKAE